ncbi:unnamed protein product [Blepharisma stoltei]|uniref:ubiquitinyl hydrolase 1 n=1 Tax=Blepharisma stoltei TaxID=1481888 RepID=A0AAU9IQX7_9CILI|nr:unnamed protein product [Blepharisma stoltei]
MGPCLGRNDHQSEQQKGIPNIGNTCYMNSVIQVLAATPNFLANLDSVKQAELIALKNFIQGVKLRYPSSSLSILANDFKNQISQAHPIFQGSRENDAKELFAIILSILGEEETVTNPFNIVFKRSFKCEEKNHIAYSEEKSNLIIIPKGASIENHLKNMDSEKKFWGDNQLYCEKCKKTKDITMKTERIELPEILVLYTPKDGNSKNNTKCLNEVILEQKSYILYAVICYNSWPRHYYAYTRISEKSWRKYNDDRTSESNSLPEKNAYLLFYKSNY